MQLPLAIVLTLTFVWLYFNVNFKSDIQFNFPYKFRASFWSSSYCCGILFHSGLWVRGSGSCQSVVSPLLSASRDHRSNAQILYLEPPFTTASCSRNAIDQDMWLSSAYVSILFILFQLIHSRICPWLVSSTRLSDMFPGTLLLLDLKLPEWSLCRTILEALRRWRLLLAPCDVTLVDTPSLQQLLT